MLKAPRGMQKETGQAAVNHRDIVVVPETEVGQIGMNAAVYQLVKLLPLGGIACQAGFFQQGD